MRVAAIVSGGLDSVTLAYELSRNADSLRLVSFDYGQKHRRELEFAEQAARRLDAEWTLIDLVAAGVDKLLVGSALTDSLVDVPDGHYAEETMKATIVPNRNAIMLAIASAAVGSLGMDTLAIAVHGGDHFIYPDCRREFIRAFEKMERLALDMPTFRLEAPFLSRTKADIVRIGSAIGVPFLETWSCYKGGATHCGTCGTCVERKEAFELAGVEDPTVYTVGQVVARG